MTDYSETISLCASILEGENVPTVVCWNHLAGDVEKALINALFDKNKDDIVSALATFIESLDVEGGNETIRLERLHLIQKAKEELEAEEE